MKDIPGYEGKYAITEDGKVWSYKNNIFLTPILKKGYYCVYLCDGKSSKEKKIHRLLALTYIPNPENLPVVDHIDRNRTNNSLSNLRWASFKTNANNIDKEKARQHIYDKIFNKKEILEKALKRASEVNSRPVEMRDKNDHSILYKTFSSSYQAAIQMFGNPKKNRLINYAAHKVKKSAYGYYWCFVGECE